MIDWTRITELEQDLGADEIPGLIAVFLAEVEEVTTRLAAGDPADEAMMHFLKGSALTLGLQDFAALADAGERALNAAPDADVDTAALLRAYDDERAELLTRYPLPSS